MNEGIRINKYISDSGTCSRRHADDLISSGLVTIDGRTAVKGDKVYGGEMILVEGKPLAPSQEKIYIAYHKPSGVICTSDRRVKGNIIDALDHPQKVFTVGRLDKDSTGLILLTNDGDIVNRILRAGNRHEKEYRVVVDKPVTSGFINDMAQGVPVLGTITSKCKVMKAGPNTFVIILTQGLNRQIRRMCEYFGYEVISLHRTRIMNITLSGLKPGMWRYLTYKELRDLKELLNGSSGSYAEEIFE